MRSRAEVVVVFCVALLVLGWGAGAAGIATAYVDPLAKIPAQDEGLYASTALEMAAHGDWMTPRLLGRYVFYKPPVEYWLAAASVKILGRTRLALRAPSIVAGAGTITLIFCWLRAVTPLAGALAGALLLLSSHMFFVLSRVGMMDGLLTFETVAAMYALARDPRLESRGALLGFGCASGAAIMTKALAGLFPLLTLAVLCVLSKKRRPRVTRLAEAIGITAAIALPWHLWQLYLHPRWFWVEYVLTEHLTWGLGPPEQVTRETQAGFYFKRLVALDPLLFAATLAALIRARARVPLVWMLVVLACCMAFQYRNAAYLMPVFPAMAVLVAIAIPKRWAWASLAVAGALFIGKALAPKESWGIPFKPESFNPSQPALEAYAARHRGNDLIIVEPDDQFYSACLDLARVRYVYITPQIERRKLPLDFEYLGIAVTADDFMRINELRPVFAERLREWKLDSTEPIATVILARSKEQVKGLIASHPESDFYLAGTHEFLLSGVVIQRP